MIKGIVLVLLGAASYGILATFVKLAYNKGFSVEEVTFSQYSIGFLILWILHFFLGNKSGSSKSQNPIIPRISIVKMLVAGTSLGFTGIFYYSAVQTIPVSICIVLLMQSVWMGVLLEAILDRTFPSIEKISAMILVLIGTVLATDAIQNLDRLNLEGLLWGLLAALSYTVSLYASNRVGLGLNDYTRSAWMMTGAWLVVLIFSSKIFGHFDLQVFFPWGIVLAIFGTILPPILLNKGFPITGMGVGSILVSLEIPVSVAMAIWLLGEKVNSFQSFGLFVILIGIAVLNLKKIGIRKNAGQPN